MAGMEEPLVAAVAAVVCLETVAMASPVVGVGGAGHRTARMQMALLEEPVVEAAVTVETMQLRELPGGQMVEVVAVDKVQMAGLAESLGERGEVAVATADARVDMPEVARAVEFGCGGRHCWLRRWRGWRQWHGRRRGQWIWRRRICPSRRHPVSRRFNCHRKQYVNCRHGKRQWSSRWNEPLFRYCS